MRLGQASFGEDNLYTHLLVSIRLDRVVVPWQPLGLVFHVLLGQQRRDIGDIGPHEHLTALLGVGGGVAVPVHGHISGRGVGAYDL